MTQVRGSFINHLMTQSKSPAPLEGMGATLLYYTDRAACTIQKVSKSGKTFWMTHDHAERTDNNGMSDAQEYEYIRDPDAFPYRVTLRTDGVWKVSGGTQVVAVGFRNHYHDFSF